MDEEILKKKYSLLTKEVKNILFSKETAISLWDILESNQVTEEQASNITNDLVMTLIDINNKSELSKRIVGYGVEKTKAEKVAKEIEEKIFYKLEKTQENKIETKQEPGPKKENFVAEMAENKVKASKVRETKNPEEIEKKKSSLSQSLRDFINSGLWKQSVAKVARQFNLKEGQMVALENEVFLTLLCFEPPSDLKENIKRELELDENAGRRITDSINGAVLGQVMGEIKSAWKPKKDMDYELRSMNYAKERDTGIMNYESRIMQNSENQEQDQEKKKDDTLEIIKRAMQPAKMKMETPDARIMNHELGIMGKSNTENKKYEAGKDPYREQIES